MLFHFKDQISIKNDFKSHKHSMATVASFGAALIFAFFMGIFVIYSFHEHRRVAALDNYQLSQEYLNTASHALENFTSEYQGATYALFFDDEILVNMSHFPEFSEEEAINFKSQLSVQTYGVHQLHRDINSIYYFDSEGNLISLFNFSPKNKVYNSQRDVALQSIIFKCRQSRYGTLCYGNVYINNQNNFYAARELRSFAYPDVTSGFVICLSNLNTLGKALGYSTIDAVSDVLVLDRNDNILYSSNGELLGKNISDVSSVINSYLNENSTGFLQTSINNHKTLITASSRTSDGLRIICMQDKDIVYASVHHTSLMLTTVFVIALLLAILTAREFYKYISEPLEALATKMSTMDLESPKLIEQSRVSFIRESEILRNAYNGMIMMIQEMLETQYRSVIRERTYQLAVLKAKIHPHFLYNTLNSIQSSAIENKDNRTADMINLLSAFFRESTKTDDIVLLGTEFEYIQTYTELLKIQHEKVFVKLNIDDSLRYVEFPNFSLQPLVENAYAHGLKPLNYTGTINVDAHELTSSSYSISISNSGKSLTEEEISNLCKEIADLRKITADMNSTPHIGLLSSCSRMIEFFGDRVNIELVTPVGGGFEIRIEVQEE